jgi:putative ABC transport system permease protein
MIFSLLAIIIAVLGMFALALFFINQRNKEIAIRKVLGANSANLLLLLTQNYFSLLLISAAIGFPSAYLLMHNWLNNFAVRISLGWWFFVIPLFLLSMLILLSVSQQIIKTSRINPAEALKYE